MSDTEERGGMADARPAAIQGRPARAAATGIRIAVGVVVSAVAVAAVVGGIALSWPTRTMQPVAVTATPAPSDTVLACDGPLLALGRQSQQAAQLTVAAEDAVVSGVADDASAGGSGAAGSGLRRARLATPDVTGDDGVTTLTVPPVDGRPALAAAASSAQTSADDLAGFAASACRPALMESWLVGGATTTGSADLVVLANPGTVAATVQLTVYGPSGPQTPPGGSDLVVAAKTQRVVPLAGLVLNETSPVVRVTASGAPVQASLQSSIVRTLVPGGVDQEGAIQAAATTQVITGVRVTSAPGSDPTTVLRMLAPTSSTTATVTVATASGTPGAPIKVSLSAGKPTEVELPGLAVGAYTIAVTARAPIVAAVWQATGLGGGSDFAWVASDPAVTGATAFAVPAGPDPTVAIANPGSRSATVSITPAGGGAARSVAIAAGSTTLVPVTSGTVYELDTGTATIRAAVAFAGDGAVATIPVWPSDAAASVLVVRP